MGSRGRVVKIPHAVQPAGRRRGEEGTLVAQVEIRQDADASDGDSLSPAVTRAAAILGLLAESAGTAAGPSEIPIRILMSGLNTIPS